MDTRKTVVGAAAVLAAGVVSVATANTASAQSHGGRITSIQQLKTSIHQAVVVEALSSPSLSCCPAGQAEA